MRAGGVEVLAISLILAGFLFARVGKAFAGSGRFKN
jgi:hypothetical protein